MVDFDLLATIIIFVLFVVAVLPFIVITLFKASSRRNGDYRYRYGYPHSDHGNELN